MMRLLLIALIGMLMACGAVESKTDSKLKALFCFGLCFTEEAKIATETKREAQHDSKH